ncbi:YHS domain-containing protein [Candidatus Woesearchaeota archaeon]|nr:YHS domain-containing protein [Candidatus Woesearchaeota archaeon]
MAKDPICGMDVDEKNAEFKLVKNNKKYYFCSESCYEKFMKK